MDHAEDLDVSTLWSKYDNHTDTNYTFGNATETLFEGRPLYEVVIICVVVTILSVVTFGANVMVIVAFKMEKKLQILSNYFLLSLAVADMTIGILSMPFYTVYVILGKWPLGPVACDLWLSLDYTTSNASVANLLVICIDRYLTITRPLTYGLKRTRKRAAILIAIAWLVSVLLWTPWIFAWPFIEGQRTVAYDDCYIQFLVSNPIITVITACVAFYLPVAIMVILYYKVYKVIRQSRRESVNLQGRAIRDDSKKSAVSNDEGFSSMTQQQNDSDHENDDITELTHSNVESILLIPTIEEGDSNNCDHKYYKIESDIHEITSCVLPEPLNITEITTSARPKTCFQGKHVTVNETREIQHRILFASLRESSVDDEDDDVFITTREPFPGRNDMEFLPIRRKHLGNKYTRLNLSQYTEKPTGDDVAILLDSHAGKPYEGATETKLDGEQKMTVKRSSGSTNKPSSPTKRKVSITLNQFTVVTKAAKKFKEHTNRKGPTDKQETKAAKILSAILLVFIITWTPYNIFAISETFCNQCIPKSLYDLAYWLCYINSTINPLCYALCNANFRKAFLKILSFGWLRKKVPPPRLSNIS